MLATRVLDTSIGLVAVDLVDGHVHEITVAGEHGFETLGQGVFEGGFDRSEEPSSPRSSAPGSRSPRRGHRPPTY